MKMLRLPAFAPMLLLAITAPALAQDVATSPLPAICTAGSMQHGMEPMGQSAPAMMMGLDEAHSDLAAGMTAANSSMMQAMTAEDIDVAFVCSMIPHHQSAIAMAKAELEHGDDPWARELAQKVIDAQESEVTEMLDWLSKQPAQ